MLTERFPFALPPWLFNEKYANSTIFLSDCFTGNALNLSYFESNVIVFFQFAYEDERKINRRRCGMNSEHVPLTDDCLIGANSPAIFDFIEIPFGLMVMIIS